METPVDRPFVEDGGSVVVHCSAGLGRAGTIAVCVLVRYGMEVEAALERVRADRPGAGPQVGTQLDLVVAYAATVL